MKKRSVYLLALFLVLPNAGVLHGQTSAEGLEFFEKRIRPLLADNCYQCHSVKKQRGGLLLDSKASILKGGDNGAALVAGQPEKSRLIRAVRYTDPDLRMPPRGKLSEQQINDLVEWVKRGAPVPDDRAAVAGPNTFDFEKRRQHWAFQPIKSTAIPKVGDGAWGRNPLDAFILAGLESKGLRPAPEADKRTLIRRLTFDLTGLPPTPTEVEAFVSDTSPHALETLVERLLASPAYGERWSRHWLDLVRYAETLGHEFDFELPFAYQYRDYVIRALNDDLPYDQFVVEHLAGDLLPNPRRHPLQRVNESIIGTGFFFLGEGKHSPVDIRAEGAERSDNQIDVLAKTFLGLTVSCARCHDHKFDPIYTKDYYALAGYLRSSRYQHANINPPELSQPLLARMQEHLKQAQTLAVAVAAERLQGVLPKLTMDERLHLASSWPEFAGLRPEVNDGFATRRRQTLDRLRIQQTASEKQRVFADFRAGLGDWSTTGESFGDRVNEPGDAVVHFNQPLPVDRLLGPGGTSSGRLGVRTQGALRSPTFTISNKFILFRIAGRAARINLIIDGFQHIRDPIYGRLALVVNHGDDARWHAMNVEMWVGHRAYIECLDESDGYLMLDRVVFADNGQTIDAPNPLLMKLLADEALADPTKFDRALSELLGDTLSLWRAGKLDTQSRSQLVNRLLKVEQLQKLSVPVADETVKRRQMQQHLEARAALEATLPRPTYVMALTDGTGEDERVFIRGNHRTLGEEAPRRLLEVLVGKEQAAPKEGSGRLELARRLIDPANPLPARVLVNRLWHHHFGAGIVRSPDDFGHQGQTPTHPELLDWLATEFVKRGWSLKEMHRLMVTSSTYRMASQGDAKAEEIDPENKLWHRMGVRRLEAEAIRDAVLSVSGRLDRRLGGRGPMPHLTPHMQGRGKPGQSGPLDSDGRRSLYINVRRNFLNPLFLAFDYPIPFTTIGRRSVSNVPAQALAMMNNPFVRQQAELWAKRTLEKPGLSPRERIESLYQSAFGRPPIEEEVNAAMEFVQDQGAKDDVRTWAELCHVLLNVKEFIFLN